MDAHPTVIGGRYSLLTVIGRGGMSTVYLALDQVLNKQWAAKRIKEVSDPAQRELIVRSIVTEASSIPSLSERLPFSDIRAGLSASALLYSTGT